MKTTCIVRIGSTGPNVKALLIHIARESAPSRKGQSGVTKCGAGFDVVDNDIRTVTEPQRYVTCRVCGVGLPKS